MKNCLNLSQSIHFLRSSKGIHPWIWQRPAENSSPRLHGIVSTLSLPPLSPHDTVWVISHLLNHALVRCPWSVLKNLRKCKPAKHRIASSLGTLFTVLMMNILVKQKSVISVSKSLLVLIHLSVFIFKMWWIMQWIALPLFHFLLKCLELTLMPTYNKRSKSP